MERRLESLAGKWQLVRVDKKTGAIAGNPFPATVPGDIINELHANGMIDDPYLDMNSRKCQWVNEFDWLYRRRIEGPCPPFERRFLRFNGVDYEAWFRLNGAVIGSHEGMFGRAVFEVTSNLARDNEIEVLIVGRQNTFREKIPFMNPIWRAAKARMQTVKAQYSYGWDFAPALKGGGIWDDVYLHSTGPAAIEDIRIRPDAWNGTVQVELTISSRAAGQGEIEWRVEPVNHEGPSFSGVEPVECPAGFKKLDIQFAAPGVKSWEPWDMGEQNLYRFTVEVRYEGEPSDALSDTFGFRTVGFESNPRAPASSSPWTLVINGRRLFLRGVNWIPMDSLLGRLDEARYRKLLTMARDMGANFIRIWGGGLREKKVFYDICDELGLLVWQEFPFACAFFESYPKSAKFLKMAARESAEIVKQLRNHPSLFIWCGGNELHFRNNAALLDAVRKQVETLDGTRRFHPISPSRGDSHNWTVWHGKGNLDDYLDDDAPLVSEFGLQAAPSKTTIMKMMSEKYIWPPNEKVWAHHNTESEKLLKYAECIPYDSTIESFIDASQRVQAHILKTAVERWRRMKFAKAGFAVWQLNDPWPNVSWSVIDYFGEPKLAYHALKMSMAPLMVALFYKTGEWRYGEKFIYDIAVINDFHRPFHDLTARVFLGEDEIDSARFEVRPNSIAAAERREYRLKSPPPYLFRVSLSDSQGVELARNEHDIDIFDPDRASLFHRILFKTVWKWMTREPKPSYDAGD